MVFTLATVDEILPLLGERLRRQRLAQGLAQSELAAMAGLSLGAVRKLERSGQSSVETMVRVVKALGLVAELEPLFEARPTSIAQMERAERARQRQRAPRRAVSQLSQP